MILLAPQKQYLFGTLFSENPRKTCADESIVKLFFTLFEKKQFTNFKSSNCKKTFSPIFICYWYNLL